MFHRNLIRCQHATSPAHLQVGNSLNLILTRSRSRYKGKKTQDLENVVWEDKNVPDPETTDFEPGEFLPRRLTYMPEGLPQHRGKKIRWWNKDRTPIEVNINPPEKFTGYTEKPNYPPIIEMSTGSMRQISEQRELRREFYRSLEKMPSYDQKLFELTDLKAIPLVRFRSFARFYDYLPLYNYITRTHLIDDELPSAYSVEDARLNELVKKVKPHILNVVKNHLEFETTNPFFEMSLSSLRCQKNMARLKRHEALIQNINNVCMKNLIFDEEHLKKSIVEYNADVNAHWWGSQFSPSHNIKPFQVLKIKKINLPCQYQDYAPLNIRINEPLKPILDQNDELLNKEVPKYPTHPFKLGWGVKFGRCSTYPGFLPPLDETIEQIKSTERGDFPFLTYLNRETVNVRNESNIDNFNDDDDVVKGMAVLHNFAYLTALASVHGFTTYSELTYPFTNQTIITDGQYWSFFVYQMNTHSFHNDLPQSGKCNVCWSKNNIKLYESYKDGKFEGVNDEAIKNLIRMYIQKPKLTEAYSELRPHLSVDERSEEAKLEMRENMRRRFAGYMTQKEYFHAKSRKVHKFEWVYIRNPVSSAKFMPLVYKQPETWPIDKVQIAAHEYKYQKLQE